MDVDTVEERSQIFVLDYCGLVDTSADLGHFLEVDTLQGQVVLFLLFSGDDNSFRSINSFVDLEAQEVLDFESLSSLDYVNDDREMGVSKDHSELVANSHSSDHVSNDASDGT